MRLQMMQLSVPRIINIYIYKKDKLNYLKSFKITHTAKKKKKCEIKKFLSKQASSFQKLYLICRHIKRSALWIRHHPCVGNDQLLMKQLDGMSIQAQWRHSMHHEVFSHCQRCIFLQSTWWDTMIYRTEFNIQFAVILLYSLFLKKTSSCMIQ